MPTLYDNAEGHGETDGPCESASNPAQSKTPSTHGNSSHGNREIPGASEGDGSSDRSEKAQGHASDMYALGKSDSREVPEKRPNKEAQASAEVVEGRRLTKGNPQETAASRTQSRTRASTGLERVREVARETFASSPYTRGKSRMRECRTYGSERGAPGNRGPYRDR
jgi:hypothetical protein